MGLIGWVIGWVLLAPFLASCVFPSRSLSMLLTAQSPMRYGGSRYLRCISTSIFNHGALFAPVRDRVNYVFFLRVATTLLFFGGGGRLGFFPRSHGPVNYNNFVDGEGFDGGDGQVGCVGDGKCAWGSRVVAVVTKKGLELRYLLRGSRHTLDAATVVGDTAVFERRLSPAFSCSPALLVPAVATTSGCSQL